jgi:8-amino-7-oxononanoate synthase
MGSLFDKFRGLEQDHARLVASAGGDPLSVRIERLYSPTQADIAGRRCVLLGSNNYLGLTFDADAIAAGQSALAESGTGTTGSRVANGSYAAHQDLEAQLADFFGCRHAILFSTGYQANVGVLSAIAGKDDTILIDSDCHASIYDGCKLGNATVLRFRHNDPADLDRRLKRLESPGNALVVIEGIYSMLGDRAPVAAICEVARRRGAYLMVDEAHSLGVTGAGACGVAEEQGVLDQVDFVVGTFSKSLGTVGGFCVSNHAELAAIRLSARAYLFTASLPPSVVATASQTLARLRAEPALRERLWRNTDKVYDGLADLGFRLGPEKTPVIAVRLEDATQALTAWQTLLDHGVYVNLALPPATPGASALLRCSVCAAHTPRELDQVLEAFAAVGDTLTAARAAAE